MPTGCVCTGGLYPASVTLAVAGGVAVIGARLRGGDMAYVAYG